MNASDAVQQIKDRLNIVDVISPYVELHKAGRHFKGRSPFTNEKTPSFYVSPERGMYYCFSTSQGGDIFTFIQTIEGVDFKEALKTLAMKAGIELVPENPKKRGEREQMYQLLEVATNFFSDRLQNNSDALAYLEKRQVTMETIKKWRIGYAPGPPQNGWRELRQYLKQKGFNDDLMLKAGVIKNADAGKEPFDVFRDRIMFPLKDQNGKVVAYSGRVLTKDSTAPKYVNSPETELYHKSDMLYGYDVAKHSIRQLGFWLVVEGQFDVVMSHQVGYTNAVAVSGTAMTPHHVQLLERLSNKVVLALDADRAGIAAMKRAASLMLKRGMDVKVAIMPDGADPADLAANNPKDLKRAVGQAVSIIEFLLHQILSTVSDVRMRKLQVRDEIVPFLALIESRIDQEHFEGLVAAALDASREAIHTEVVREIERQESAVTSRSPVTVAETDSKSASPKRLDQLRQYVNILITLVSPDEKLFLEKAVADLEQKMQITHSTVSGSVPDPGMYFTAERDIERLTPVARQEEVVHTINTWRQLTLREALRDIREQLGEQGESEDLLAKLHLYQSLLTNDPYTANDI